MGLDMYMEAERHIGFDNQETLYSQAILNVLPDIDKTLVVTGGCPDNPICARRVILNVAYWRKANAIHSWFVKNIQNGVDDFGRYPVSQLELVSLLDTCAQVIADPSLVSTMLPPRQGFFFGNIEVDSLYFEQLKHTQLMIEHALAVFQSPQWRFYYCASW